MKTLLYDLVLERNARETLPFLAIHSSNTTLLKEADAWQRKCEQLEKQVVAQQESLERVAAAARNGDGSNYSSDGVADKQNDDSDVKIVDLQYAESAALKNERKMREEVERLKGQVKIQEERHLKDVKELKDSNLDRIKLNELRLTHEQFISDLTSENEKQARALEHLTTQVSDCEQRADLAEQQCIGLKNTIRMLQDESDNLKKENLQLETRMIEEKSRLSSEVNSLNEMVEKLRKEAGMLQSLKKHEEKQKSWFGFNNNSTEEIPLRAPSIETNRVSKIQSSQTSRKESIPGTFEVDSSSFYDDDAKNDLNISVELPSKPKHIIQAHRQEAVSVRCDTTGTNMLATGGILDGTVKVWNESDGSMIATLRGGSNNSIFSCDVAKNLVAGGGNDKTCRIWDIKSQRMVHQLVGHANIITCVRFLDRGQKIVTASKDRQIKVWDISKQTYRQTTNIVLNSTANSFDIAKDSYTLVSGHTNGSVRFWDLRTGERNAEIENVHRGAVTSVQFHPMDGSKVLTNCMDSVVKIFDVRNCKAFYEFRHKDFQTSYSWSSSVFSPDGAYVSAGSSSNGFIFVWNAKTGRLERTLEKEHQNSGVCGIAWGRGGKLGHQIASTDKAGRLILWR